MDADPSQRHDRGRSVTRRRRNTPPGELVAILLAVGTLASAFAVWVTLTSNQYGDFAVHYESMRAVWDGSDLYVTPSSTAGLRSRNPPHMLALMSPIGLLPIRWAMVAWLIVTVAAMAVCVRLWASVLPRGWALLAFALLFASVAGYGNVRFANQSWVTALAVTWAWRVWRDGKYAQAATVLGMTASIKVFLLIFLPYLCWRRQWRAVGWFIAGGVAITLAGVAVCGIDAYRSWIGTMQEQTWQGLPLNVSLLGTFTRTFETSTSGLTPLIDRPSWVLPLWGISSAAVAGFLWWRLRKRPDVDRDFAALLTSMLLLSPSGWAYYLPVAAGPLAATATRGGSPLWWLCGVICGLLPYAALSALQPHGLSTVTLASAYMWSSVFLLSATLLTPQIDEGGVTPDGGQKG